MACKRDNAVADCYFFSFLAKLARRMIQFFKSVFDYNDWSPGNNMLCKLRFEAQDENEKNQESLQNKLREYPFSIPLRFNPLSNPDVFSPLDF